MLSRVGGGLGRRHNNMGHSGGRVGLGIQRRVRAQRWRQLYHCCGEAEEDGPLRRSCAQLLHVARGWQISALGRQHRLPEKEGGCLPIRRPQIHRSLASNHNKSKCILIITLFLCSFGEFEQCLWTLCHLDSSLYFVVVYHRGV